MSDASKYQKLMALDEARRDAEMYRGLLNSAESTVRKLEAELNDSFQPANSNYTAGELAAVRRGILAVLSNDFWVAPHEIMDRLHDYPSDLVMREVHKLANDSRSDVTWNQRKGPASMYRRFRSGR